MVGDVHYFRDVLKIEFKWAKKDKKQKFKARVKARVKITEIDIIN